MQLPSIKLNRSCTSKERQPTSVVDNSNSRILVATHAALCCVRPAHCWCPKLTGVAVHLQLRQGNGLSPIVMLGTPYMSCVQFLARQELSSVS